MADKNKSVAGRIAFTLPISCQICLGKVKLPVVCPNFHVFCSPCMEIWLEKNQQCPTCRVQINPENPCKKVLGGLSHCDEETDSFSNKEIRQARISLLFKDYEDEIEHLQSETESLRQENVLLHSQLKDLPPSTDAKSDEEVRSVERSAGDAAMLMNLNKKVQEAQSANEKLNKDMKKMKKENGDLRDENVNLGRENQRLRLELAQRSPIKYGRITVTTLESKVETMEKDIKKHKIALERSDSYIEDIEKELEDLRKKVKLVGLCSDCKYIIKDSHSNEASVGILTCGAPESESPDKQETTLHFAKESGTVKKKLFNGSAEESSGLSKSSEPAPKPSPAASFYGKRTVSRQVKQDEGETVDFKQPLGSRYLTSAEQGKLKLENFHRGNLKPGQRTPKGAKKLDDISFELEQPSPTTPSASLSKLTIKTGDTPNSLFGDSTILSLNETVSSVGSCRKKLKFDGDSSNFDVSFPLPSTSELMSSDEEGAAKLPARNAADSDKQVTFGLGRHEREASHPKAYSPALLSQEEDTKPGEDSFFEQPSFGFSDDELDPNMTSDIDECMKLLDAAERKVDQRKVEGKECSASGVPPPIKPALQVPVPTHGLPGGSQSLPFDSTSAFRHFSSTNHTASTQRGPLTANPQDIDRFGAMLGPGSHLLQTHTDPGPPRRPASTSNLEHMLFPPVSLEGSRSTSAPPPPHELLGSSYATHHRHSYDYPSAAGPPSRWSTDAYSACSSTTEHPSNPFSSSGSLGLASLLSNMAPSSSSSLHPPPYTPSMLSTHPVASYTSSSQPSLAPSRLGRSLSEPTSLTAPGAANWANPGIWNMNVDSRDAKNSHQQLSSLANSYLQQKAAAEGQNSLWK